MLYHHAYVYTPTKNSSEEEEANPMGLSFRNWEDILDTQMLVY